MNNKNSPSVLNRLISIFKSNQTVISTFSSESNSSETDSPQVFFDFFDIKNYFLLYNEFFTKENSNYKKHKWNGYLWKQIQKN